MERWQQILPVALLAALPGCNEEEPQAPPAPSGNGSVSSAPDSTPQVEVLVGTLVRRADGSETIVTARGDRYRLRRMPGCKEVDARVPKRQQGYVTRSDCLEYAMARLLVAQAIKEKPGADTDTLRRWLRTPGGHMVTEFQRWPDEDVATMIEICRHVGRSRFVSGDFPRPTRRKTSRRDNRPRRYRFRGTYRGRVFEAQSITRV